jgi:RNA polymerase sigma-70 factor (ECF subfamily)
MAIDIETYYVRYGPLVFRRCMQILKDQFKAEDAMQEVFIKVMRYEDRLKDEYPSSLLYRIATNVCLNMIRSEKRKREGGNPELLEMIACYGDNESLLEARDLLDKIFRREKESTRLMAVMHWVDGMTLEQVADEMKMSVSGVRKRLREMKARVRDSKLEVD